jgi:hypothetical protein
VVRLENVSSAIAEAIASRSSKHTTTLQLT